jgi:hypothetical protein
MATTSHASKTHGIESEDLNGRRDARPCLGEFCFVTSTKGLQFDLSLLDSAPKAWARVLTEVGASPGSVNLLCGGRDHNFARAACFAAFAFLQRTSDGTPLFQETVVVLPPVCAIGEPRDSSGEQLLQRAAEILLAHTEHTSENLRTTILELAKRTRIVFSETLLIDDVIRLAESALPRCAVYIEYAGQYWETTANQTSHHDWRTRVASATRRLKALVERTGMLVLLDTGHLAPFQEELEPLRCEDVGMFGMTGDGEKHATRARLDRIFEESGLAAVLSALAATTELPAWDRAWSEARYYDLARRPFDAFGAFFPHMGEIAEKCSPEALLFFARIAVSAGQKVEGAALLESVPILSLTDLSSLQTSLSVAFACGKSALAARLVERVCALFPGTPFAVKAAAERAFRQRSYEKLSRLLDEHPKITSEDIGLSAVSILAHALSGNLVDYEGLMAQLRQLDPAALPDAYACAIAHATSLGLESKALALAAEAPMTDRVGCAALEAIEKQFLGGKTGNDDLQPIIDLLPRIIVYVAENPWQRNVRAALAHTLSHRISGFWGAAVLFGMVKQKWAPEFVPLAKNRDISSDWLSDEIGEIF